MAHEPRSQQWDALIDENLKRVFEEDATADLPPQLLDLLAQLDKIEAPAPSDDTHPSGEERN